MLLKRLLVFIHLNISLIGKWGNLFSPFLVCPSAALLLHVAPIASLLSSLLSSLISSQFASQFTANDSQHLHYTGGIRMLYSTHAFNCISLFLIVRMCLFGHTATCLLRFVFTLLPLAACSPGWTLL